MTYYKKTYINRLTSLLLLAFLLISTISHTHEFDVTKTTLEQQECKLCQHTVDKIPQRIKLALIKVGEFKESTVQAFLLHSTSPLYLFPPLRAPPENI